jgi:predicted RecA/RadA family phage recombinase
MTTSNWETSPRFLFTATQIASAISEIPASISSTGRFASVQVANAYGIPYSDGAGIKIGIVAYGGGWLQSDVDATFNDLRAAGIISPSIATPTINQVLLEGQLGIPDVNEGHFVENALDIACVATIVPAATITIYIGSTPEGIFPRMIADGVDIVTYSYTGAEFANPPAESLFSALAANHIAFCVSTGDFGSSTGGTLGPGYPSTSPNAIAVGGTKLRLNGDGPEISYETDANDSGGGGGGGISTVFSLPSWQSGLYYTPITNHVIGSPTPLTTRGVPDVSLAYDNYGVYLNGVIYGVAGTSASAPVLAGILARVQKLTGIKRSSAEYNSIFYAHPNMFRDITVGRNDDVIVNGYAGTTGWDAVTGLGPPNGLKFMSYLYGPNVSTLSALTISSGTLSPTFASGTTSYTANVISSVSSINITATTTQANATLTLNGSNWNGLSSAVPLSEGSNTITIVATSQDTSTTNTYTITVTRDFIPTYTPYTPGNVTSVNEGNLFVPGINTTYVANGTTIYWKIVHITTSDADFATLNGSFNITNNSGHATTVAVADTLTEGSETFYIEYRTGSQSGTLVATSGNYTINDTSLSPPTYFITVPNSTVNEGSSLVCTVNTTQISDGTILYWTINHGTTSNADFGLTSGSFTITSNVGTFTIPVAADLLTEGIEIFTVSIRTGSITGPVVTTSGNYIINDTSLTPPTYSVSSISTSTNEGVSAPFNISTTNVVNDTTLYWTVNHVTTSNADVDLTSGSFSITSNTGTFTVPVTADLLTEGRETFSVSIRTGSITGPVVATSSNITINDTSLTPPTYSISVSKKIVNEGASLVCTVTTTQISNGTILYWKINNKSTTVEDFDLTSGSFTITSNVGTFAIPITADLLTEGRETFSISIRTGSQSGNLVATSSEVTINDTSLTPPTYSLLASKKTVDESSPITFTVNTYKIANGTILYWQTLGTTFADRFSDNSTTGSVTVNNNQAIITRTLLASHITEGPTSFVLRLYSDQNRRNLIVSSDTITVNDTSGNDLANIIVNISTSTEFIGTFTELVPMIISFIKL